MTLLSLYLSPLLSTLLISFVTTFTRPISTFRSLMSSQLFSKTSRRRIFSYFNIFSLLHPSAIQTLLTKETYFELPSIEHLRTVEKNLHHWLVTDILQMHHIQYQFFQNLTLNTHTKEQIRIYTLFLRLFLDITTNSFGTLSSNQDACTNFLSQISKDELLPFVAAPLINTLPPMTSVISQSLILNSSLMILKVSTNGLNFLLLSDHIIHISLKRLLQIPLLRFHSKLSLLLLVC